MKVTVLVIISGHFLFRKGPIRKLYKKVTYPVLPRTQEEVNFQDGWAASRILSLLIPLDSPKAIIELTLTYFPLKEDEWNELKTLGWTEDLSKLI